MKLMEESLFSFCLSKYSSIRTLVILLVGFLFTPLAAADSISDQIIISGDAAVITVPQPDQASDSHSGLASVKPKKCKKIRHKKKKMIAREPLPEKKIQVQASAQSLHSFPVQESHSFILAMTAKVSGLIPIKNMVAMEPLHKILINEVSLLYGRINSALFSTVAFEFSRRYTCRPPPLLI